MKIGLLVCDHVPDEFRDVSGDYEDMFRRLFDDFEDVEIVVYDAINGDLPSNPAECDAWLASGSRHSVNDDLQWIRDLEEFVRRLHSDRIPFIGICFGHQLLAKALGGSVAKSDRGWGVGVSEVEVSEDLGLGDGYRMLTSHQDQVIAVPNGAEILGWNAHCPVSVLGVGDMMIGFQGHPEFDHGFSRALLEWRRGHEIPEEVADAGLATLDQGTDSATVGAWIVDFVKRVTRPSEASGPLGGR